MRFSKLKILIFFNLYFLFGLLNTLHSQSSIDSLKTPLESSSSGDLYSEKIIKISENRKIFIISNDNHNLNSGDYITIVVSDQLVARGLVAKTEKNLSGVKIIKIYSLKLWNYLMDNQQIQLIKGDDSYFVNLRKQALDKKNHSEDSNDDSNSKILTDNELFAKVEDDDLDEKGGRAIKTDNIISAGFGQISGTDTQGHSHRYTHWNGEWAYQFLDNLWGEVLFGMSVLEEFPNSHLSTRLMSYTFRVKYTISAPFYSFIQPYLGYQIRKAKCPGAGEQDTQDPVDQNILNHEKKLVEDIQKNSIVFGGTILKRLVPGWFIKADIGTDLLNIGFSFEF